MTDKLYNVQCPCKDCILVAMCRHRRLEQLMYSCQLVVDYTELIVMPFTCDVKQFYESDYYNFDNLIEVFKCLAPTRWSLDGMYSGR